ncbi:MAG: ribosome silencing factor [Planctomycetota bacterium]
MATEPDAGDNTETTTTTPEPMTDRQKTTLRFCVEAAYECADLKCTDVKVLDVRGLSPLCDFLLLATATSQRQMGSVAVEVAELAEKFDLPAVSPHKRSDAGNRWLAMDLVDAIVHLFDSEARDYYDLDALWGDAVEIRWFDEPRPEKPGHATITKSVGDVGA